ncbi:MAG TPA: sugar-binding protein [Paenibacillus sp.]|uniref:sugar-binding protein n=1 Tax=Paenibacillus sp. TaxID=58172 RepID=UPI002BCC2C31|nr:sugar-binding protein [Paenibacillus sp.]HUC93708.1 sugar-binding protein [Paenibacillus sp.]
MIDPSKLPVTAKTAEAAYGQPAVDGNEDLVWSTVPALQTETKGGLKAAFKTLRDEGHLYVWAKVDDAAISAQDKIDIFAGVGGVNTRITATRNGEPAPDGTSRAIVEVEGGYVLEAAIPLPAPGSAGAQTAFDLRVTDGDANTTASWSDMRGNQEADPSGLGTLTLNEATYAARSVFGTPVIDGERDRVWAKARERSTERWAEGADGATAKFRTLWDHNRLYVYAEVADPLLTDASANAWEEDSVEIFLDQNNGKTGFYQGDDGQYRINFNNVQSYGGRASAQNLTSAVKIVDGGYIVEAAIAFDAVPPAENGVIGFDLQVNDDRDGNGSRDSVAMWSDPTGQSYTDTSRLGVLQLMLSDLPAPRNVSAKALYHQNIRVNWSDVEDAYGYDVYRATGRSGPFERVNKKPVRGSHYVDHKLKDDTTYYYKVTAIDKNGESAASETVSSTTEKSKGKGKKNKED